MPIEIRRATIADAKAYFHHTQRHFAESGRDGDLVFHPLAESWRSKDSKEFIDACAEKWSRSVAEEGWEAVWCLADGDQFVGHVNLRSGITSTALHRCALGIGMERHVRGQGWGRKLMETAITWTRSQPTLDYIDLYVFAHNTKARALYESFGFKVSEINKDQFRFGNQSVDDIHMVLPLRK